MKIGVKLTSELIYVLIYVMVAKLLKSSMKIIIFFLYAEQPRQLNIVQLTWLNL